ncbi:hypothetical protein [Nocardia sp. NPDC057030]|uniref:hypothetical protein n=1 Tax=unclassified Nocardia TaxID=2637762 RepID=UPI00363B326F
MSSNDATEPVRATQPDPGRDCAGIEEQSMREDFARVEELRRIAWHAKTEKAKYLLLDEARELEARWFDREDELGEAWHYLNFAYHDWLCEPEYMARLHEQIRRDQAAGVSGLTDTEWRSQCQARDMRAAATTRQGQGRPQLDVHELIEREGFER